MTGVHRHPFKEETYELLSELESSLLELDDSPENKDVIGRVFRAMHTIKGSGPMFGFDDIASFTHEVETVFGMVRNGKLPVTKTLISLRLSARDQIKSRLDSSDGGGSAALKENARIIEELRALAPYQGLAEPPVEPNKKDSPDSGQVTYRIRFVPSRKIFRTVRLEKTSNFRLIAFRYG